jgi:hypothetical protein
VKRSSDLSNVALRPILAEFGFLVDCYSYGLRSRGSYDWRGWYESVGIDNFVLVYREENEVGEGTFSISDGVTPYYGGIEQLASWLAIPFEGTPRDFISIADNITDLTGAHAKLKTTLSSLIVNEARKSYSRSYR